VTLATVVAMVGTRSRRRRGSGARWWRVSTWLRRHVLHSDAFALAALALCAVALGALFLLDRSWFPLSSLALVLLVGGFMLTVRSLLLLDLVVGMVVLAEILRASDPPVSPGAVLVVGATRACSPRPRARPSWPA